MRCGPRCFLAGVPTFPEAFGRSPRSTPPGSRQIDLDDANRLVERELRPSAVVARDRSLTQRWALRIFEEKRWAGIRWWSHYDSRWGSFGLWDIAKLKLVEVVPLEPGHPALVEAAAALSRPWRGRP
jgi:hypothetical protein